LVRGGRCAARGAGFARRAERAPPPSHRLRPRHGGRELARSVSPRRPIGLAPGAPREAAGQDAAKYGSTNPVVHRLFDRWMARLLAAVGAVTGTVVDVGVGEGLSLERVLAGSEVRPQRVVGVEYRSDKAQVARGVRNLDVTVGDAGMVPLRDDAA